MWCHSDEVRRNHVLCVNIRQTAIGYNYQMGVSVPPPIQVGTESVNAVVLSRLRCSEFLYVSKYVAFCIYVAFLWLRKGIFGREVSLMKLVQSWEAIIEVILEPQADEYTEVFNEYKPMTLVVTSGLAHCPPWLYERINFLSVYGQCGLN